MVNHLLKIIDTESPMTAHEWIEMGRYEPLNLNMRYWINPQGLYCPTSALFELRGGMVNSWSGHKYLTDIGQAQLLLKRVVVPALGYPNVDAFYMMCKWQPRVLRWQIHLHIQEAVKEVWHASIS